MMIKYLTPLIALPCIILMPCAATENDEQAQEKLFKKLTKSEYSDEIRDHLARAQKGDALAYRELGRMWLWLRDYSPLENRGRNDVERMNSFAFQWLIQGVEAQDGISALCLADFYSGYGSLGHEPDAEAKKKHYQELGFKLLTEGKKDRATLLALIQCYKRGYGTEINELKAKEIYEEYKKATQGSNEAPSDYERI